MKTNNQSPEKDNQIKNAGKQQQADQSQNRDRNVSEKKETYVKDLPPIDGARPGIL